MDINERIKFIRTEAKLNQTEFGRSIGISRDAVANIEGHRMEPKDIHILAICRLYNVSEEWIRTGSGKAFIPQTKNQIIADWVNRVMCDKDESFRKKFIFALSNMSEEGWDILEKFAEDLNKEVE